jgi:hypothetical protein
MLKINENAYYLLEQILELMEVFGLPLSIIAWMTVFLGSIAMGVVLSKFSLLGNIHAAIWVGAISLTAHLADYFVTLEITPDLALEANPLWRNVIDGYGLGIAKWYGLTGKIMLAILSFEFYAYYLLQREKLFPEKTTGFLSFFRQFGANKTRRSPNLASIFNYFSFMFSLLGAFYFYIAMLNSLVDSHLYLFFPAAPIALLVYLLVISLSYFLLNYRKFRQLTVRNGKFKKTAMEKPMENKRETDPP